MFVYKPANRIRIRDMPRTAPTFDDTPNLRHITLHLVDASGDVWAESFEISLTATATNIEALVADYAARTHANIYKVTDSQQYNSPKRATDATIGDKSSSVADGINFGFLSNTNDYEDVRLVAPIGDMMVDDTDAVDPTEGVGFGSLVEPVLSGTKVLVTSQYTERKERRNNPKNSY